ncbi:MAG: ABC transporter substrate-binding protein, partial [Acidobacteria bacterium]|nr:ABC transporter substrate-binding protein [Acidobacteriota bacterium]
MSEPKPGNRLRFPTAKVSLPIILILTAILTLSCRRGGRENELTVMLEKRIETFDPRVSSDSAAERIRQLIFNGLTRKDEKFDPIPDLAERFESSPDYKTFTFHLRPNIKFHNGEKLSAADVKYTFDTMMARGFQSAKKAEIARDLASVELGQDPKTVLFRCNNPCPGLPNTILPVGIIPAGTTDQQARRPIGTGPFKFESYVEDQEATLTAFDEYFEGRPSINRLAIKIIPDNSTRESELRKGSVDLAINADFDPVTVEELQKAEGLKVEVVDGTNIAHLGINLQD